MRIRSAVIGLRNYKLRPFFYCTMMTVIRLSLLASLCAAAPFNLTLDKPKITNEDMEEDNVVNDSVEVDREVHYHERNTTDLNADRKGKFQFSFGDVGGDINFGTMITNNEAPAISTASGWSGWSDFGPCSATCGAATRKRERTCTGGAQCPGSSREIVECTVADCDIDSEAEVDDYHKMFLVRYPGGKIERTEFMKMAKEYFEKVTRETSDCESFCNNVFNACDTRDGTMSFREAVQAINVGKMDASEEEKIKYSFRLCDINKDGEIDKEEFYVCIMGLMKAMGKKDTEKDMEERINEMMAEMDINKDGKVTEEELNKCNKDSGAYKSLCNLSDMIGQILNGDLLKAEAAYYHRVFLMRYPSGKLERTEFIKMAKKYFEKITHQTCDAELFCNNVFKACNTDGSMSFREAVRAIYAGKTDAPKEEKIKYSFRLCDINKDGEIDKEELYDCMMGLMKALGKKDTEEDMEGGINEMMTEMDTNDDGKVTEEEFTAFNENSGADNGLCQICDMTGQILQEDLLKSQ